MITFEALCVTVYGLDRSDLAHWIDQGWVRPEPSGAGLMFRDIDVARVRLIRELRDDMGVEEETLPVVLSLVDQLYDARRRMRRLRTAIERAAPDEVKRAMLEALQDRAGPD